MILTEKLPTVIRVMSFSAMSALLSTQPAVAAVGTKLSPANLLASNRGQSFYHPSDLDIILHRGAGSYECGEETALLESLEGKRAQPRLRPPFPAVVGLYGCPTIINNVETLANVPFIILNGPEWFTGIGPEKNTGPKLFCVSGHVNRPGVYEASMDTTLRQLIYDYAGGIRGEEVAQPAQHTHQIVILAAHQLQAHRTNLPAASIHTQASSIP